MKLIKFSIIVFVLLVRPCRGKLVIATASREKSMSRLADDLGNILTSCYGDRLRGVGLAGNLPSTLFRTLTVQHSIPVALIGNKMNFVRKRRRQITENYRSKLHVFIIEGSSTQQLDTLINNFMKFSIWWNHMASFFILDLSRECVNAKDYLFLAWKNDMLNAKLICRPRRSERIMFDYNPFTSHAPVSWQRADVFPGINNHPFTLLGLKYQESETICADLKFDKTKDLGGYTIRLEGKKGGRRKIVPGEFKKEWKEYYDNGRDVLSRVYRALNAKQTYNGKRRIWDLLTEADMMAQTLWLNDFHTMSRPTGPAGRNIVTHFRNREPRRFSRSFTVSNIDKQFGTPVVYLIALLAFKFFVDQALVPALLKLIRRICNKSFINLRDINSTRVYLIGVCFLVTMMQPIFHATLMYPLTKQIPLRNVETLEDLVELGYKKVYGRQRHDKFEYQDVGPKNVFQQVHWNNCIFLMKNSSSSACTGSMHFALDDVDKFNLHLSREYQSGYHEGFAMRDNWPLEERVNTMLARLVDAGAAEPWYMKYNSLRSRILRKSELDRNNRHVESIKLGEITFAFVFLGIGLACATIVFIIELVRPYRCRCRTRLVRRHWLVTVKKNGSVSFESTLDYSNVIEKTF